jgi:DNA-damage-inducible protein D
MHVVYFYMLFGLINKRRLQMIEETLTKKSIFQGKEIRKIFFEGEWYLSVIDVIASLTESENPRDYWYKMKVREKSEAGTELSTICRQLKLEATDGKKYETDCATIEGIFRIIQSIPSPKAEPFKRWLAKLGKERIEEIENPELGIQRAREIYEKKGYSSDWIEKRIQSMAIRKKLTNEWDDRGAETSIDYAILTNEIMKNAFGMEVGEYKKHKGLKREELRDHMADLELIITMLGEATTTKITKEQDSQGMKKLKLDAQAGGAVAGRTRKDIEAQTNTKVITQDNFLGNKKIRKQIGGE